MESQTNLTISENRLIESEIRLKLAFEDFLNTFGIIKEQKIRTYVRIIFEIMFADANNIYYIRNRDLKTSVLNEIKKILMSSENRAIFNNIMKENEEYLTAVNSIISNKQEMSGGVRIRGTLVLVFFMFLSNVVTTSAFIGAFTTGVAAGAAGASYLNSPTENSETIHARGEERRKDKRQDTEIQPEIYNEGFKEGARTSEELTKEKVEREFTQQELESLKAIQNMCLLKTNYMARVCRTLQTYAQSIENVVEVMENIEEKTLDSFTKFVENEITDKIKNCQDNYKEINPYYSSLGYSDPSCNIPLSEFKKFKENNTILDKYKQKYPKKYEEIAKEVALPTINTEIGRIKQKLTAFEALTEEPEKNKGGKRYKKQTLKKKLLKNNRKNKQSKKHLQQ